MIKYPISYSFVFRKDSTFFSHRQIEKILQEYAMPSCSSFALFFLFHIWSLALFFVSISLSLLFYCFFSASIFFFFSFLFPVFVSVSSYFSRYFCCSFSLYEVKGEWRENGKYDKKTKDVRKNGWKR